jgi:hypothetical protein
MAMRSERGNGESPVDSGFAPSPASFPAETHPKSYAFRGPRDSKPERFAPVTARFKMPRRAGLNLGGTVKELRLLPQGGRDVFL